MSGRFSHHFQGLGRAALEQARQPLELWSVTSQTVVALIRFRIRWREVLRQLYEMGNRSVVFVTATLGFLGLITVYQVAHQVAQILPDFSMLGAAFLQMLVREFGPTICGLMVATRVGSGIAAEIGSMVVTEQVDALRMCNADPVEYLVVPRTAACGLAVVLLTAYGAVVATFAGMVIAEASFGINPRTFLSMQLVGVEDLIIGVTKAFSYGCAIPVIAGHAGLYATGGSEGVGWATTRAVVNTSFAVIVLDLIISGVGYVVLG